MTYDPITKSYVLTSGRRIQKLDGEEVLDTLARFEGSAQWKQLAEAEREEIRDHVQDVMREFVNGFGRA